MGGGTLSPVTPGSPLPLHYCTVADVEKLMQTNFSQSSRPTPADVEGFIRNIAAEIDGVLQSAGYTLPISDSRALEMLRMYCTYGVAVAAWHSGWVSQSLLPRVEYWERVYADFLARLRRGEQELPGTDTSDKEADIGFEIVDMPRRDDYWSWTRYRGSL